MTSKVVLTDEIRVCMDVGSAEHYVAIGFASGKRIQDIVLKHEAREINQFFGKIEKIQQKYNLPVVFAMEGYNGHIRPIDKQILEKGYKLYSVNHLHLARYRELFPAPAKTDRLDAWKIYEFISQKDNPVLKKTAVQEVFEVPEENEKLKCLSRRRRRLVKEQTRLLSQIQVDLSSSCPGLASITGQVGNLWFLRFLSCRMDLTKLKTMRRSSLLGITGIGKKYVDCILEWQKTGEFSRDTEWIGPGIIEDAKRLLDLHQQITSLNKSIEDLIPTSQLATLLRSIPGFGAVCVSEIAGELGDISRFKSEASFGYYCGMAPLTCSSGKHQGARRSKNVNKIIQAAMMVAAARHISDNSEADNYYKRKRSQGKKHNQAVRAFGRHLCRVIWSMLRNQTPYNRANQEETHFSESNAKGEIAEKKLLVKVNYKPECDMTKKTDILNRVIFQEKKILQMSG